VAELFYDEEKARGLAYSARQRVMATRDMGVLTRNLVESYREVLRAKRSEPERAL
jgi:hypothetical protein